MGYNERVSLENSAFDFGNIMSKHENEYQPGLKERIAKRFPGCFMMKNDAALLPGVPDLIILYGDRWAVLEVKRSKKERDNPRPLQEYYVERLNNLGFSAFIYPEIETDVLDAMEQSFAAGRDSLPPEPE